MSGTTTFYGWSYPSEGDAPDGAAQMQTIATAVDTTVHGIDVRVATLEGHDPNKPPVVFTAAGSFTATQAGHAVYLRIRGVNGGAGSGGCATTTTGQSAHSGPGAGGAYAERTIAVAGLTFPLSVTVGIGGSAGAAGANAGVVGGPSSVVDNAGAGATLWTPGVQTANQKGLGGAASGTVGDSAVAGFDGSTTSPVADFVVAGSAANTPTRIASTNCVRTRGGDSALGSGGNPGNGSAGSAGVLYGGGGGGSYIGASTTQVAGAAGANGIVIIEPIF